MTITTEEVRALAEGARKATPGKWAYADGSYDDPRSSTPWDVHIPGGRTICLAGKEDNAAYLAACSPEFILALAQDWLRMREALENMLDLYMSAPPGAFNNGVTDATGSIDEGEVRASIIADQARMALSATPEPHHDAS